MMSGKRGNNEGTIRKRGDGRWEARVSLPDGKSKSFYGKTRQEVANKLREALHEKSQGILPSDERQTLEQYLISWLEIVKHEVDASSHLAYQYHVRRIIRTLGKFSLGKLKPQQVQLFYAQKLSEGLAPTTVKTMHVVLHHALKDAVKMGVLSRNVTDMVKPPRFEPKPKQVLSEDEARKLIEAAKGERLEALYVLVLSTGMREGELFALEWKDIDFDRGILYVRQGLQHTEHGYILHDPKSNSSRRTITMTKNSIHALREHKKRQEQERQAAGEQWDTTNDFVFPNQFGRHKVPTLFLAREFPRVLKKAGVPTIHFHDLRHTAATILLSHGVYPKVVSEMLGHSNISITLGLYGHVLPNMQRDAADMMNKILERQEEPE